MSDKQLPIEQIAKLAEDVRLIKDFAENHNFDTSLLTAKLSPKDNSSKKYDNCMIVMVSFICLVLATIAVIKLWSPPLSTSQNSFAFIVGLVFIIVSSMAAHIRFQDKTVTGIVVVGLLMALFIGAGIFTPQEAVDKVGQIAQ